MHKSVLMFALPLTVETRQIPLFSLQTPTQTHIVRAGLAIASAAVFLERVAAEQRSIFYTAVAVEPRATKISLKRQINVGNLVSGVTRVRACSFYSSKKHAWLQYKKPQIQAPGTFSSFSDKVRLEGGHGNCCRFAPLTGVPILALPTIGQRKKTELEQKYGTFYRKNSEVEVLPVVDLIADSKRLCRTNGLLSRIKYRNRRILVWPTCGSIVVRRNTSKNAENTALDTNSNSNSNPDPAPTHTNFASSKSGVFFSAEKLVDHTKSHYKIFPDFHTLS